MITWRDIKVAELRYQELGQLVYEIRLAQQVPGSAKRQVSSLMYLLGGTLVDWGQQLKSWAGHEHPPPPAMITFDHMN